MWVFDLSARTAAPGSGQQQSGVGLGSTVRRVSQAGLAVR